ncbi:unnamed protein product [Calicophoron daubneyi]|uniref:Uncharacterized protein n=1 Tax=Calicophoron daubneyi TaxID=300641 RepID=A0AAV2TZ05_CALDB
MPAAEYNEVKSVLASKLDELSAAKEKFFEAMDKVNHLTTTTISTEKHTEILSVIRHELRAKSSECEQFENERQVVISLLDNVSSDPSRENLLDRLRLFVGAYVSAKNGLTAAEDNYRTTFSKFQSTKEQLCSLQTELRELVENHEIELARVREDMTNKQKIDLEEKSREHAPDMEALSGELEKYRTEQQKLIPKVDELQAELDKANEEIRKLRSSLTAQTEYAQAANEAAAAHEQHAKALASHLDSLKLEHGKCPTRLDLVDAQTSPVRISFTPDSPLGHANEPSTAPPTSKQDGRTSSARRKKYEELKTVAFEIKEKLIQRTK